MKFYTQIKYEAVLLFADQIRRSQCTIQKPSRLGTVAKVVKKRK